MSCGAASYLQRAAWRPLHLSAIGIEDVRRDLGFRGIFDVVSWRKCTGSIGYPVGERFLVFPLLEKGVATEWRRHASVTVERMQVVGVQDVDIRRLAAKVAGHSAP